MELSDMRLTKYLHEFAIEEVKDKYEKLGYRVLREYRIGSCVADLYAQKDKHKIFFEIKVGKLNQHKKRTILKIKEIVNEKESDAEFKLINISPPKKVQVEIIGIEDVICEYLAERPPEEIDVLSTHTRISDVTDIDIGEVKIDKNLIFLKGTFLLEVELQYGSDVDVKKDVGLTSSDSFVTEFELEMDGNWEINSLQTKIDTSSWYE